MSAPVPSASFLVDAANLVVLRSPEEYQEVLFEGIRNAKKRIGIVTLYVGAEQKGLLSDIFKRSEEGVDVHILADHCRTLRPEHQIQSSKWLSSLDCMKEVFSRGLAKRDRQPMISLFHVPRRFAGQQLFPWRMQETLGVAHWKFYVFDNDVILTGANIAQSYLTNRMDRWLVIRDEAVFVDFLWDLALTLRDHSNTVDLAEDGSCSITQPKAPVNLLCPALESFLAEQPLPIRAQHDLQDKALLHWGLQCGFDPTAEKKLAQSEQVFIANALSRPSIVTDNCEKNALEGNKENIQVDLENTDVRETKDATLSDTKGSSLVLASPYLNLPLNTIEFLRKSIEGESLHIIGASPDASSFFQGGPVLSAVPWAYLSLTCKALSLLGSKVRVKYFSIMGKGQRTFHAKGVWNDGTAHGLPYKTLLGSTNLSERSVKRDLECLCLLETAHPSLIEQFREEVRSMKRITQAPKAVNDLSADLYQAPFLTRLISKLFVHNPFLRSIL